MTRLNTGLKAQETALMIVTALIKHANDSFVQQQHPKIQTRWDPQSSLLVRLQVRDLIRLVQKMDPTIQDLTPVKVKEAFKNLMTLGLLQDTRMQRQGSAQWSFSLALGSHDCQVATTLLESRWPTLIPSRRLPGVDALLMQSRTRHFVGREHIFSLIDQFMTHVSKGYFTLEGAPGTGKTSLVAEYIKRHKGIACFMGPERGNTQIHKVLSHLGHQLITRFQCPHLANLLKSIEEESTAFWELLQIVADQRSANTPLVIAIDGLDQLIDAPQVPQTGINPLHLPPELPDHVYFLITHRPGIRALVTHVPQYSLRLSDYDLQNQQDISTYIRQRIHHSPRLQAWIRQHSLSEEAGILKLTHECRDNFMVLQTILDYIQLDLDCNFTLLPFTGKLEAYYHQHWQQMKRDAMAFKLKLRILSTLCTLPQPLTCSDLSASLNEDPLVIQGILDEWQPFLCKQRRDIGQQDPGYSVYHPYFQAYLSQLEMIRIVHQQTG